MDSSHANGSIWKRFSVTIPAIVALTSLLVSGATWAFRQEGRTLELEHKIAYLEHAIQDVDEHGGRPIPLLIERENQLDLRLTENRRILETSASRNSEQDLLTNRISDRQAQVIVDLAETRNRLQRTIEQIDRLDTPLSKIVVGVQKEVQLLKERLDSLSQNYREMNQQMGEITRRQNDVDPILRTVIDLNGRTKMLDQKGDYILEMLQRSGINGPQPQPH